MKLLNMERKLKKIIRMFLAAIFHLGNARWIISEDGWEFGFRMFGVNIWYYKYSDVFLMYRIQSDEPVWKPVQKHQLTPRVNLGGFEPGYQQPVITLRRVGASHIYQ